MGRQPLTEIDAIRELLGSRPRSTGWAERRQRLDEVWPVWNARLQPGR